jgi:hypothetical protein
VLCPAGLTADVDDPPGLGIGSDDHRIPSPTDGAGPTHFQSLFHFDRWRRTRPAGDQILAKHPQTACQTRSIPWFIQPVVSNHGLRRCASFTTLLAILVPSKNGPRFWAPRQARLARHQYPPPPRRRRTRTTTTMVSMSFPFYPEGPIRRVRMDALQSDFQSFVPLELRRETGGPHGSRSPWRRGCAGYPALTEKLTSPTSVAKSLGSEIRELAECAISSSSFSWRKKAPGVASRRE